MINALTHSLIHLEERHDRDGWERPPALYLLTPAPSDNRYEARPVPVESWHLRGTVYDSVRTYRQVIAAAYYDRPAPAPRLVAVAIVVEDYVKLPGHPERQRARIAAAGRPSGEFAYVLRPATASQIEMFGGDKAGRSQVLEHELSRMAALLSGVQQPLLDPYLP
ncbi:hypothetical protein ETD86_46615 [Nonomuraea turkmeniaca]|uniref:Uncharacterized protein n=1 Tax=Nonomuraea turkmeniaca TaxID=103838 RepID=A0A5S4EYZ7_9ACTN|nr:hypothetical protein [Nonomuraea turkmeniaca]TMR08725.1 hypothetical protein ETD86_46615 [Nonomuraea turkmeniaca]